MGAELRARDARVYHQVMKGVDAWHTTLPRAVVVVSLVVFGHMALELWRSGASPSAWLAAALLSLALGGFVGVLTYRMTRGWVLAASLVGVAAVFAAPEVMWALRRVADLNVAAGRVAVVVAATLVAGLFAAGAHAGARRLGLASRSMLAAIVVGVASLAVWLEPLQTVAPEVAVVMGVLAALTALLAVLRGTRWALVLPALSLVGMFALTRIPNQYPEFHAAVLPLVISVNVLWLRGLARVQPRPTAGRVLVFGTLACATALLLFAEHTIHHDASIWRVHPSRVGGFSTVVRLASRATDFDRDGYGLGFGDRDCAPLDPSISPSLHEVVGNDVDENCRMGPASDDAIVKLQQREEINARPSVWKAGGDVVLVVVDALRAAAVRDPSLDGFGELKRNAIEFTAMHSSSSFTTFAMLGMLAGDISTTVPLEWFGRFSAVPTAFVGLHAHLAEVGYQTSAIAGPFEANNPYFSEQGFFRGFDRHEQLATGRTSQEVTAGALQMWRQMNPAVPRFMWVHYLEVHEKHGGPGYGAAVRSVDAAIGALLDGLGPETLVVVTADHGEEQGEHGGVSHAQTLYQEVVRVPFFMRIPGSPARLVASQSSLRSVPSTVLSLVAPQALPPGKGPYLCLDQSPCHGLPAFMQLELRGLHLHGVVANGWKIVRDLGSGTSYAFDLRTDPSEQQPVYHPPDWLTQLLVEYEETLGSPSRPFHARGWAD